MPKDNLIEKDYERITNKQFVQINIDNGLIHKCVGFQFNKLPKTDWWKYQYIKDLEQDLIVFLMEYDNDKLNDVHKNKHDNAFITRMIINQIYSVRSKFYAQYIKFNMKSDELEDVIDETE